MTYHVCTGDRNCMQVLQHLQNSGRLLLQKLMLTDGTLLKCHSIHSEDLAFTSIMSWSQRMSNPELVLFHQLRHQNITGSVVILHGNSKKKNNNRRWYLQFIRDILTWIITVIEYLLWHTENWNFGAKSSFWDRQFFLLRRRIKGGRVGGGGGAAAAEKREGRWVKWEGRREQEGKREWEGWWGELEGRRGEWQGRRGGVGGRNW